MKILLATDGSKNADAAALFLARIPHPEPLEIRLISVLQMPELHHLLANEVFEQTFIKERTSIIEAAFDRIENGLSSSNCVTSRSIVIGHPGKAIVDLAEQEKVDLVVVGALGTSLVDDLLLGSTGEFVATHCKCSVLVVRPETPANPRKWLVAYDGSDASAFALTDLVNSGFVGNSELQIVQCLPTTPALLTDHDKQTVRKELLREANESLRSLVSGADAVKSNIQTTAVEAVHVGSTLCKKAKQDQSSVIVMGSTGKGLMARFMVGSASRYALRHAPCSVWIARDRTAPKK